MIKIHPRAFNNFVSAFQSAASNQNKNKDLSHANLFDVIGNVFTGNLDYQRAIEQAERAERVSAQQSAIARAHSSKEAEKLRRWQEKMSNTAYSRAVADLKSVGINPYAIGSFNSASTPSGAYGQSFAGSGYASSTPSASSQIVSIANSAFSSIVSLASKRKK